MRHEKSRLIEINKKQAEFYNSFHTNNALNLPSRLWRRFRCHIKSIADVDVRAEALEWELFEETRPRRLLEVGCYVGRPLTVSLIGRPWLEQYVGVELSAEAVRRFRAKLDPAASAKAEILHGDFAALDLPRESFDAVYMNGVFHHFPDPEFAVRRVAELLVPNGAFITFDPLLTNWLFRTVRAAYRPFQSDREWEFPLQRSAFDILEQHLELRRVQGFLGMEMYGAVLAAVVPLPQARAVAEWCRHIDRDQANRIGSGLFRCNLVVMWWQKPDKRDHPC